MWSILRRIKQVIRRLKEQEKISRTITIILFVSIILFEICVMAAVSLSNGVEAQLAHEKKEDQTLVYAIGWDYDTTVSSADFFALEDKQLVLEIDNVEDASLVANNRKSIMHFDPDRRTETFLGSMLFKVSVSSIFVEPSYFRIMEMLPETERLPNELDHNWAVLGASAFQLHSWDIGSELKDIYDPKGFGFTGTVYEFLDFVPDSPISVESEYQQTIMSSIKWLANPVKPLPGDELIYFAYGSDHDFLNRCRTNMHFALPRVLVSMEEQLAKEGTEEQVGYYIKGSREETLANTFFNPEPYNYLLVKIDSKENVTLALKKIIDTFDKRFHRGVYAIPVDLTPPLKIGMDYEELKPLILVFLFMIGISMLLITSLLMLHLYQERKAIAIRRYLGSSTDQIERENALRYLKLSVLATLVSIPGLWLVLNICYHLLGIRYVFQISLLIPFLLITLCFTPFSSIICSFFVLGQSPIEALQAKSRFRWWKIDLRRELSVITFFLLIVVIQQSTGSTIVESSKLEARLRSSRFDMIQIQSTHKINEDHLPSETISELIEYGVEEESVSWQGIFS